MKVCILSAGTGSRMNELTNNTNKVLLPYKDKAIISTIIANLSHLASEFIITLGYKGDLVKQYLKIAHPNLNFKFIQIDNYDGEGSGPGYTLLKSKTSLNEPFICVCGDTLWNPEVDKIDSFDQSWIGVSPINKEKSRDYCCVKANSKGSVIQLIDKSSNEKNDLAFNGIFYIKEHSLFFKSLNQNKTIYNETQISNGLDLLIKKNHIRSKRFASWIDIGNWHNYHKLNKDNPNYIFKKKDEYFYEVKNSIIKYDSNPKIIKNKVTKQKYLSSISPNITDYTSNFFKYNKVSGQTLYKQLNTCNFQKVLDYLLKNLWTDVSFEKNKFFNDCRIFYKYKTIKRILRYKNYFNYNPKRINDQLIQPIEYYLNCINWDLLFNGTAKNIHGDLTLDNIIIDKSDFHLIDWRSSFGNSVRVGDIYYDFAKLYTSLILDIQKLKNNNILCKFENDNVTIKSYAIDNLESYIKIFTKFIKENNYNLHKVKILSALIIINMSPLHQERTAKTLWSIGKLQLHSIINHEVKLISHLNDPRV